MGNKSKYTKKVIEDLVSKHTSIRGILREIGLNSSGGSHNLISKKIKEYKIDTSHFIKGNPKGRTLKISLDKITVVDSTYNRYHLKKRLLNEGYIKNKCEICGLEGWWNGEPIIMILDHINGIHNDHRIENLRMLCPNCNSQQPTFAGKNQNRLT